MAKDKVAHKIAARMLGISPSHAHTMHSELYNLLAEAENLMDKLGGHLASRQVIATLIVTWKQANPHKKAV